ncbi:30S ribosomal protein S6 [Patescibacteria group bacterium]|nr:30S ribosomal protein S6 [Patescibacteria group bacterium]
MKYELMVILDPRLTDKQLEKALNEVKSHIKENGFEMVEEDVWGKRDFAYKIKGRSSGYYVVMNFEGEPEGSVELHRELRIQTEVLRYLLIKVPENYKITRYSTEKKPSTGRKLKSRHAEELNEKVKAKKTSKPAPEEETEATPKKSTKLDEQLQAIIEDTDIDI